MVGKTCLMVYADIIKLGFCSKLLCLNKPESRQVIGKDKDESYY